MAKLVYPKNSSTPLDVDLLNQQSLPWSVELDAVDVDVQSITIYISKNTKPEDAPGVDIIHSLTYNCTSVYENCISDTGFKTLSWWNVPNSLFEEGGTYYWQLETVTHDGETFWEDENKFVFGTRIYGCMDSKASNYKSDANTDDGSCKYAKSKSKDAEIIEKPWPEANETIVEDEDAYANASTQHAKKRGISTRVFGQDLDIWVKRKLEARQNLNKTSINPNEPISSEYTDIGMSNEFKIGDPSLGINSMMGGDADLSTRTPVARLWTAVQIQKSTEVGKWPKNEDKDHKRDTNKIYDERKGWVIEKELTKHDKIIYEIGNHNVNILSGKPNESRQGDPYSNQLNFGSILLPHVGESDSNQFMTPPAGITGISSATEGPMGTIKKTSVNFTVHNFHDYDKIYSRYFLRPGAYIFVDFGWSSSQLYDPKTLVYDDFDDGRTMDQKLYDENGYVTRAMGDLEVLSGYVVNYDAKIKENGSVECSLEIVSKNNALMNHSFGGDDTKSRHRMAAALDAKIINFASKFYGNEFLKPNKSYSAGTIEEWNKAARFFASKHLQSPENKIEDLQTLITGVFWRTVRKYNNDGTTTVTPDSSDKIYISWGLFEDLILNDELGIGKDKEDVQKGENLNARFDSSNSFIGYHKAIKKMQESGVDINFNFLYPEHWKHTYNTVRLKVPSDRIVDGKYIDAGTLKEENYKRDQVTISKYTTNRVKVKDLSDHKFMSDHDIGLNRIPMREVYISLALIKRILKSKDNAKEIVEAIISEMNKESEKMLDLKIANLSKHSNELQIVDRNYVQAEKEDGNYMNKMFTFKPYSPDTIVKSMDLSFSMPEGDLQNMIAIQNASAGTKMFPATAQVDRMMAMNIQKFIGVDENIGMTYLPDVGNYKIKKFKKSLGDGHVIDADFYDPVDALGYSSGDMKKWFEADVRGESDETMYGISLNDKSLIEPSPSKTASSTETDKEEEVTAEEAGYYPEGTILVTTIANWHKEKAKSGFFQENSTVIPVKLSLTIYGFSALVPGDIFKVDFLPAHYRDTVYFQVVKTSHEIGTTSWTTSIETMMRISPGLKQAFPLYAKENIFISHKIFDKGKEIHLGYNKEKHVNRTKGSKYNPSHPKEFGAEFQLSRVGSPMENTPGGTKLRYVFDFVATVDAKKMGRWTQYPTKSQDNMGYGYMIHNNQVDPWRKKKYLVCPSYNTWCKMGKGNYGLQISNSFGDNFYGGLWNNGIASQDGPFGGSNYIFTTYIDLVAGKKYKLVVQTADSWGAGWAVVPYDAPAEVFDKIDVGWLLTFGGSKSWPIPKSRFKNI